MDFADLSQGTGTELGDPTELEGIASTLGSGRTPNSPLWVGSVKSNVKKILSLTQLGSDADVLSDWPFGSDRRFCWIDQSNLYLGAWGHSPKY